jgi:hypothetical protein
MKIIIHIVLLVACFAGSVCTAKQHPVLFSGAEMKALKGKIPQYPLLQRSFDEAKKIADEGLNAKIDVPLPADEAGGYTHNRHKRNYEIIYNAGKVYAITGEAKYAVLVKAVLLRYAEMIPALKDHPKAKGSSPGRLFHQALNDCNWIVHSIQGYDAVYETLTVAERQKIEASVFMPLADHIRIDLKNWFNLIHNHGVWACAAVGMTGLVLQNEELVRQSLYGSSKDSTGGFLAQLSQLFSPAGYYVEGPYYARYALLPFYTFASALNSAKPGLGIFRFRNNILQKALGATLQQTNLDGAFFPINDAIKDKTWLTSELVFAIGEAVKQYGEDQGWLAVAQRQGKVSLSTGGLMIASSLSKAKGNIYFPYQSMLLSDGADGRQGGLAIIRTGEKEAVTTAVLKATSHGLSHGHFDRLNLLLFDDGNEILKDYGAARFLNVEQKDGGRYLKENSSYAMQTIAHNTVVVDEKSHYGGREKEAERNASQIFFSNLAHHRMQVVSAKDTASYKGVVLHRTLIVLKEENEKPIIIDIFRAQSDAEHQYDLPFYYGGQFIATNFKTEVFTSLDPLGTANGYQHLWKEARASVAAGAASFTFLNGRRYYSISTASSNGDEIVFARAGANDPSFNLRREPCMIVRKKGKDVLFANVLEIHGSYNGISETSTHSAPGVKSIEVLHNTREYTAVEIRLPAKTMIIVSANQSSDADKQHQLNAAGRTINWKGPFYIN